MKVVQALKRAQLLNGIIHEIKTVGSYELNTGDLSILEELKANEDKTISAYPNRVIGRRSSRLSSEEDYWSKRKKDKTDEVLSEVRDYLKANR